MFGNIKTRFTFASVLLQSPYKGRTYQIRKVKGWTVYYMLSSCLTAAVKILIYTSGIVLIILWVIGRRGVVDYNGKNERDICTRVHIIGKNEWLHFYVSVGNVEKQI
jgi:hypothetical protein